MNKIRSMVADQSIVGEPERRGDERSEAARSGGSPTFERAAAPAPPIRKCRPATRVDGLRPPTSSRCSGERMPAPGTASSARCCGGRASIRRISSPGASSANAGLTPKKRGRKTMAVDPRLKKLEQENRRLTSRLQTGGGADRVPKKSFRAPGDPPETRSRATRTIDTGRRAGGDVHRHRAGV